jgi:hypothetical protein
VIGCNGGRRFSFNFERGDIIAAIARISSDSHAKSITASG